LREDNTMKLIAEPRDGFFDGAAHNLDADLLRLVS
jgi:hypothetical protein